MISDILIDSELLLSADFAMETKASLNTDSSSIINLDFISFQHSPTMLN